MFCLLREEAVVGWNVVLAILGFSSARSGSLGRVR